MDDLQAADVLIGLLGHGMFTDQLPPVFSSETFMTYCIINSKRFKVEPTEFVRYEGNRHNYQVRLFGIPNPFAYANLCWHIYDNWKQIQNFFKGTTSAQKYKVSRIHVRKIEKTQKIFSMNYSSWETDETPETDLRIGAKFVVKADITSCFPSIYTHSIPWAIMGKGWAKQNKRNGWTNKLDKLVCNLTDGETHGILIGPHASNLISEIILTKIDQELHQKNYAYIRNIDDYTAYVEDYQKAMDFLNELRRQLRDYGLRLNDKKTMVVNLPQGYEESWLNRIKYEKPIAVNQVVNYRQMQQYLDLVKSLLTETDSLAILKYTIKTIKGFPLNSNASTLTQKYFLEMALLYPYLIPSLEEHLFTVLNVDVKTIEDWSNVAFKNFVNVSNQEAIAFLFHFALKYGFILRDATVKEVIESTDCVVKTLGAKYFRDRNHPDYLDIYNDAHAHFGSPIYKGSFWLYWYSVLDEKDLNGDWLALKKNGICFLR